MPRSPNYEDPDDLSRHPDVAVRAWNESLSGESPPRIMGQLDLSRRALMRILNDLPPPLIAEDLRYRTGLDAFWISQGEADRLVDEDGKAFAFVVIMEPPRITRAARGRGLAEVRRLIRSAGSPRFSFGGVAEKAPMASLLRMVHNKRYPAWEINAEGGAAPYDGRFAHMPGVQRSQDHEVASPGPEPL